MQGRIPWRSLIVLDSQAVRPVTRERIRNTNQPLSTRDTRLASWRIVALFATLLATHPLWAEPPAITSLFPAGGQVGQTVDVKLNGKPGTAPLSFWCDQPGITAEFPDKPADVLKLTIAPDAVPGVALIRVTNTEGASAVRPFVVGTLAETSEVEPNDTTGQAQKLNSNRTVVNGILNKSGDVDTFAVELKQGETLVVSMSAAEPIGSPLDGIIQILSPEGFVIEQNDDDHGNDPQLVFSVPTEGTYFVRAFGFPSTPNSSIRFAGGGDYIYRLTITTGPFVDHVLPMAVNPASATQLKLAGWNLPDELVLKTFSGHLIWDTQIANTLELPVANTNNIVEKPGDKPQSVPFPATITGQILDVGETDVFEFEGKQDTRLVLRAEARAFHSPLDPVLRLTDAEGKSLKEVDDRSRNEYDSVLDFTLKADGRYRVEIFDRFEHAGERYLYRLTLAEQTPAIKLSVASDAFVLPSDKQLEIPITIERSGGDDREWQVKLDELPPGVTCEPVTSAAKGDSSKKVTLKLTRSEEGNAESGLIAIVASPADTPDKREFATAKVAGTERETVHLWLTIAPK